MDMYSFYVGESFDAYEYLGCHLEGDGAVFRVFAPAAEKISVMGEFNGWEETPMQQIGDKNFWECTIQGVRAGMMYKYRIYQSDGRALDHCDPYGYGMELRPKNASFVRDMNGYRFHDERWMRRRSDCKDRPLNIYEIHAGSWKTNKNDPNGWYKYNELADLLIPYLKECGYNYVELLPVNEHPCDASWGYQATGFYSPTSRYGTADDLKAFVDKCHQNEIGVIFDFVPVHFAVDDYALANFDGTPLYEYPHNDVGYNEWGSRNFNHFRGEIRSFLQSNANYWIKEYHADGLRMDAISNIIYWQGNKERGVNEGAVKFIQNMNAGLKKRHPSVILAAEDSTSYPDVTKPVAEKGLGYDYKWDMGWMNDTLTYFKTDPYNRGQNDTYHKLTFSMMYFYSESFLMPFSHDEVVHGKATIAQKMYGDYEIKFPQARALYTYMYAHPGKKLNFMGNEIAQLREWDEKREQDWDMLKYPKHDSFHQFMKELNWVYLNYPALSKLDYDPAGFQWIECHMENRCVYAFQRTDGKQTVVAVFNFSGIEQKDVVFQVPAAWKRLKLLIASDAEQFGGTVRYGKDTKIEVRKGGDEKSRNAAACTEKMDVRNGSGMGLVEMNLNPFTAKMYLVEK